MVVDHNNLYQASLSFLWWLLAHLVTDDLLLRREAHL